MAGSELTVTNHKKKVEKCIGKIARQRATRYKRKIFIDIPKH